jgi:hypothetical protein
MLNKENGAILALCAVVAGCGGGSAPEIRTSEYPLGTRWTATLATPADLRGALQVNGTAWMARGDRSGETHAEIEIDNATPGGRHPWHIHRGWCGSTGGAVEAAEQFGLLEVGDDGQASSSVDLEWPTPDSGRYMAQVHASPTNLQRVIACGNLAPPVR